MCACCACSPGSMALRTEHNQKALLVQCAFALTMMLASSVTAQGRSSSLHSTGFLSQSVQPQQMSVCVSVADAPGDLTGHKACALGESEKKGGHGSQGSMQHSSLAETHLAATRKMVNLPYVTAAQQTANRGGRCRAAGSLTSSESAGKVHERKCLPPLHCQGMQLRSGRNVWKPIMCSSVSQQQLSRHKQPAVR